MREYAKLSPSFWTGETGKALRRRGFEGATVALYLVSSPASNMLGLYYQPVLYMAHETGLGLEGASKGLQICQELGFCSYDDETETVFVHEMAAWQIADELKATDLRCKGIQKDYDALHENPFLGVWFDRYHKAFHLINRRSTKAERTGGRWVWQTSPFEAPSKPGAGAGAGTGAGAGSPSGTAQAAPSKPLSDPPPTPPDPAPTPPTPPAPAAKAVRGQRLPHGWKLPKAWGEWAVLEYPQWTPDKVRLEGERFADHWTAKTGADATKLDWMATWRNWCRSELAHKDDPRPANGHASEPEWRTEQRARNQAFLGPAAAKRRTPPTTTIDMEAPDGPASILA